MRNLDLTALRSFVAIADAGGVTKAAGILHLTQSAVSMQLKRLEDMLGVNVFDRAGRQLVLTGEGEQLLSYARKMLSLNDEVYARMTESSYEGELVLGVPTDIIYPAIPIVLQRFSSTYPRMQLRLMSGYTQYLRDQFLQGNCDLMLATEDEPDSDGEVLAEKRLIWCGARHGTAWRRRPLRIAFEQRCMFRRPVQEKLDAAGIPWEMAVETRSSRAIEATVSADLAVNALLENMQTQHLVPIAHNGALPDLGSKKINMYVADTSQNIVLADLADMVRSAYAQTDTLALMA